VGAKNMVFCHQNLSSKKRLTQPTARACDAMTKEALQSARSNGLDMFVEVPAGKER
jgi:hypothetical protein